MSRSTAGHVGLHMPVNVVWYVGERTLGEHTVSATYGPYCYTWWIGGPLGQHLFDRKRRVGRHWGERSVYDVSENLGL